MTIITANGIIIFYLICIVYSAPEYDAPLFLDCCALVRQVLRDLKEDFGFDIGPWNQAYQYDTLPITIEDEKDVKPGDLVFISGIYHNKKSKHKQHLLGQLTLY